MSETERIAAIQQRVDAASEAPWTWDDDSHGDCRKATLYAGRSASVHGMNLLGRLEPDMNGHGNLEFIANAREDVPYLLDEIATLRAQVAQLQGQAQLYIDQREMTLKAKRDAIKARNAWHEKFLAMTELFLKASDERAAQRAKLNEAEAILSDLENLVPKEFDAVCEAIKDEKSS